MAQSKAPSYSRTAGKVADMVRPRREFRFGCRPLGMGVGAMTATFPAVRETDTFYAKRVGISDGRPESSTKYVAS